MRPNARALLAALGLALAAAPAAFAQGAPVPTAAQCAAVRAHRSAPPVLALDPRPGAPRVFAMQFKQDVGNVVSYAAFRTKIECMVRTYVLPHLARGRPNVVAFNEDVGLATIATGSRGAAAREIVASPAGTPSCESQGVPCGTLAALGALDAGYARELAYYRARFPGLSPLSGVFVAATDTFARGFMQTFSDVARRYGLYVLGSNDQAPFRESSDAADVAALADPDLPRPPSVYVATSDAVYNEVFLWGPHDVRSTGPAPLRNLVASNRKVPLTPLEQELQFTPGPSTGPDAVANLRPFPLPGTRARLGFATSLPAFVYGSPPPGTDPCSDTSLYYMRCLDRLGANVVIQDEANPGRWTGPDGDGVEQWQPLSWMTSAWRATADPSVHFAYAVNPMMVGNLADLAFDGQTAIFQRGLRGAGCHYIGNASWVAGEDRPDLRADAGAKPQFLALAPWVRPDGPRPDLRAVGARLAPGSRDPLEDDYLETAVIADLPVPVDPRRAPCGRRAAPRPDRLTSKRRRRATGARPRRRPRRGGRAPGDRDARSPGARATR